ncbi:MAG: S8 family serine peptidase [Candidatus Heimdallarchaeota archaeon]
MKKANSIQVFIFALIAVITLSSLSSQGILFTNNSQNLKKTFDNNSFEKYRTEGNESFKFDGSFITGNKQVAPLNSVLEQAGMRNDFFKDTNNAQVLVDGIYVSMLVGGTNAIFSYDSTLRDIIDNTNAIIKKRLSNLDVVVMDVPVNSLDHFVERCLDLTTTKYVEPNYIMAIEGTPNDPNWGVQWGPERIEADRAWSIQSGSGSSVLVAVIDTGIDYNHPDLSSQYVALGYDFENDDNNPMDDHNPGHGTHCAGIITATINNSIGIAGVADIQVMAVKTFDSGGFGSVSNAAQSIVYAVDAGADVLSNSYGFPPATVLRDACIYAVDNDVIVIASAGNEENTVPNYPAAYPEVISVSATDNNDNLASFSSYGSTIELAAPAVDIYSCIRTAAGSYGYMSGTSMAGPHVAAVAALVRAEFPSWDVNRVRERLISSSEDLGVTGWDQNFGYGLTNAYQAVLEPPSHDLNVELETPSNVEVFTTNILNATVSNWGLSDETDVQVKLYINEAEVASQTYTNLFVDQSETLSYSWEPTAEDTYNITAFVEPVTGETNTENNLVTADVIAAELTNYLMDDSVSNQWIDATSGTLLQLSDDDYEAVSLPFSFEFYDQSFNTLYVSSNGWMSFVNTYPVDYVNVSFPSSYSEYSYAIALYWDDLDPVGNVYSYTDSEKVVIEYLGIDNYGGAEAGTFELVLYRNGNILFQYDYLTTVDSPTIGLNYGPNTGYYNVYSGISNSTDDLAILFTKNPIEATIDDIPEEVFDTLVISWTASGESLRFNLLYRIGGQSWETIATNLMGVTSYNLDSTLLPDGVDYQILIYATDGIFSDNDTSNRFIINNIEEQPVLSLLTPVGSGIYSGDITISWTGSDPDGDDLTYSIYIKSNDDWIRIFQDLTNTNIIWDTTTVENGDYELKVEANDEIFTTSDQTDSPFIIENPKTKRVGMSIFGTILIALGALSTLIVITQRSKRKRE